MHLTCIRGRAIEAVVVLCALLVFGPAVGFRIDMPDDAMLITDNRLVTLPSWSAIADAWKVGRGTLYIPLTLNIWTAIAAIGGVTPQSGPPGVNAWMFHGASVLMHAVNALLVYWLLRLMFQTRWVCAAAALVWAVHPLQVEPVAWASSMKDTLSGMLALIGLLLYAAAAKRQTPIDAISWRTWWWCGGAGVCMLMATFAKPGVAGVALAAMAIGWLVFQRPLRQAVAMALPMLFATIPATVLAHYGQDVGRTDFMTAAWTRPLIAGHSLAVYLQHLVWPVALTMDYGLTPRRVMESGWGYVAWLLPVAVTVAIVLGKSGRNALMAGWLVFVACLLPVLGLVPFGHQFWSTVTDRYAYLSLLGVVMALAWAMERVKPTTAKVVVGVLMAALAARAADQLGIWHDARKLGEHLVEVNPRSSMGYNTQATALMDEAAALMSQSNAASVQEKGQLRRRAYELNAAAEKLLDRAIAEQPQNLAAYQNIATVYRRQGRSDEALTALEKALDVMEALPREFQPDSRDRLKAAQVFEKRGEIARATEHVRKYLARHPGDVKAMMLLQSLEAKSATTRSATGV